MRDHYDLIRRILSWTCLGYVVLGLTLAVAGSSPLFGVYNDAVASAFFGSTEPSSSFFELRNFTYGILGGSIAGKWLAAWWLATEPLKRRERWAWVAAVTGLVSWFVVDSGVSLATGAMFNVWMINLVPLLIVGPMLWLLRPGLNPPGGPILPKSSTSLAAVCWMFAGGGLVVATAVTAPVFASYIDGMSGAFFHGDPLSQGALDFVAFVYGPIGGTFLAHFVMLAWCVHHRGSEAWVSTAIVTSVFLWFTIDSTMCATHGAWFNVLMVNVPCVLVVTAAVLRHRKTQAEIK